MRLLACNTQCFCFAQCKIDHFSQDKLVYSYWWKSLNHRFVCALSPVLDTNAENETISLYILVKRAFSVSVLNLCSEVCRWLCGMYSLMNALKFCWLWYDMIWKINWENTTGTGTTETLIVIVQPCYREELLPSHMISARTHPPACAKNFNHKTDKFNFGLSSSYSWN